MKQEIAHIKSIAELHRLLGLPKPKHPQVSVFRHKDLNLPDNFGGMRFSMDLYMVSLKDRISGELSYGRKNYDFQEGTMVFIAPNQIIQSSNDLDDARDDWMMLFASDFIHMSELGKTIDSYNFFSYDVSEALHLSEYEKNTINDLVLKIEKEYQQPIDKHTQKLILINLETMLNYCQRYYDRQFITRTN